MDVSILYGFTFLATIWQCPVIGQSTPETLPVYDNQEETADVTNIKDIPSYTPPEAPVGASLAETFDDPWLFERDWTTTQINRAGFSKSAGGWSVAAVAPVERRSDLALTLPVRTEDIDGIPVPVISRRLDRPLRLTEQPLLLQYEVAIPWHSCIQLQARFFHCPEDSCRLDHIHASSHSDLIWSLDSCGQYTEMRLALRRAEVEARGWQDWSERKLKRLSVAPLRDGARHQLGMLLFSNNSYELWIDRKLRHSGSLLDDLSPQPLPHEDSFHTLPTLDSIALDMPTGVAGLYLDNLLITSRLEDAHQFRSITPALPEALPLQAPKTNRLDAFLVYSSRRWWMYPVIVLSVGVPLTLLLSCCLPESLDLEKIKDRKKKDLYDLDSEPDGSPQGSFSFAGRLGGAKEERRRLLGPSSAPRRRRPRLS